MNPAKCFLCVATAACIAILPAMVPAQVVINEIVYDDSGPDDYEFIELYNAGSSTVDISGFQVFCTDELFGLPGASNQTYTIPSLLSLLPPGGFYVLGNAGVPGPLTSVFPIPSNGLENDTELFLLKDAVGTVLDSVCVEASNITNLPQFPTQFLEGQGLWGSLVSSDWWPTSYGRWIDGRDTNDNGADFGALPATPGGSNAMAPGLPLVENFDALPIGGSYAPFNPSFVPAGVIDPTAVINLNPNSIVPSPQGGRALVVFDPTGGGNTAMLRTTPASDFRFEAWVYMKGVPRPAGESEIWGIGARGTVDPTFYNPTISSGNTGIAWEYVVDSSGGTLRLVDENYGGNDEVVLQTFSLPALDAWYRLRLEVTGNQIDAIFGGTYGSILDGTRYVGPTTTTGIGTFYMGYREMVAMNSTARPLTLDALSVTISPLTSTTSTVSVLTGTTVGFGLHGGAANANRPYLMVLSVTGGAPGVVLGASQNNTVIPVVPDWVTDFGLSLANIDPLFGSFFGLLGPAGEGVASSTFPPLPPISIGINVWFGCVTFNSLSPVLLSGYSSNSVRLTLTP